MMNKMLLVSFATAACASLAASARAADGGIDAGDTDAGPVSDDPCYLDNGNETDVGSLFGCNGPPPGPAQSPVSIGAECAFDSLDDVTYGNCPAGLSVCYPYAEWYGGVDGEDNQCGICLARCTDFSDCPDGESRTCDGDTDCASGNCNDVTMTCDFEYDFCSSDCPGGMRCWAYGGGYGLCMIDCADDSDCATSVCDPIWKTCVPRTAVCGVDDTDTGTGGGDTDTGVGTDQDGGTPAKNKGGCSCDAAGSKAAPGFFALLLR
ncbi:MAG: hypothetical protein PHU25_00225 [Deltaproteobacteria bacterium]|nr:hypothetical protein [Deltaproteobacteria bacterium]